MCCSSIVAIITVADRRVCSRSDADRGSSRRFRVYLTLSSKSSAVRVSCVSQTIKDRLLLLGWPGTDAV